MYARESMGLMCRLSPHPNASTERSSTWQNDLFMPLRNGTLMPAKKVGHSDAPGIQDFYHGLVFFAGFTEPCGDKG